MPLSEKDDKVTPETEDTDLIVGTLSRLVLSLILILI
jgi:hypothetical protein